MERPPAFQFYPAEYLADAKVELLTLEQEGAYIRLLSYCWREGSIPADLATLSRLCKGASRDVLELVAQLFTPSIAEPSRLVHKRLEAELKKQVAYRRKQAVSGADGAESRWGGGKRRSRSENMTRARKLGRHTELEWQALLDECGSLCVRCGVSANDLHGGLVRDHIKPIYQGGSDGIDNIQPLCKHCNSSKGPDNTDLRPRKMTGEMPGTRQANASQMAGSSVFSLQSSDTPPTPPVGEARAASRRRPQPTRVPDSFELTPELRAWAHEHAPELDGRLEDETEAFLDYWRGAGKAKADWPATWRNWIRKARTMAHGNGNGHHPKPAQAGASWSGPSWTEDEVKAALDAKAEAEARLLRRH